MTRNRVEAPQERKSHGFENRRNQTFKTKLVVGLTSLVRLTLDNKRQTSMPRRDSNPQSQQARGSRPTPLALDFLTLNSHKTLSCTQNCKLFLQFNIRKMSSITEVVPNPKMVQYQVYSFGEYSLYSNLR